MEWSTLALLGEVPVSTIETSLKRKRLCFLLFNHALHVFYSLAWGLLTVTCRFDKEHNIRKTLVESLKKEFPDYGLT